MLDLNEAKGACASEAVTSISTSSLWIVVSFPTRGRFIDSRLELWVMYGH